MTDFIEKLLPGVPKRGRVGRSYFARPTDEVEGVARVKFWTDYPIKHGIKEVKRSCKKTYPKEKSITIEIGPPERR